MLIWRSDEAISLSGRGLVGTKDEKRDRFTKEARDDGGRLERSRRKRSSR